MAKNIWNPENKAQAIEDILEHVSSGKSVKSLIDNSGRDVIPSYTTWCEWLKEDEDLAKNYARAMEVRQEVIFEEMLEIADKQGEDIIETDNGVITNHNVIQRNKLQIETRQWVLGRMNAKKYGNKLDVTSDGKQLSQPIMNIDPFANDEADDSPSENIGA